MISERLAPVVTRLLEPVSRYHAHRVVGIEHVPKTGAALLVIHHSLATYDSLLLAVEIWRATGRAPAGLAHDRFWDLPGVAPVVERLGMRRASPENARALLAEGHLVGVAPGGMWEALRPSTERYRLRWHNRKGFVRTALEAQVPLVLAACPAADDLFDVDAHPLTDWFYDQFKWPLPMARGRRGLFIPRRIPLVHHVAPPLLPPPLDAGREDEQVEALHAEATQVMLSLLERR